jgi:hypothetical protein
MRYISFTGAQVQILTQKALARRVVSVELLQDAVHQGWAAAATDFAQAS